jgi:NADPH-dependent 2,4-dienoyl-CoA reductase/sulfur reductase-like enzyme/rhodanese-related sulfurtransferase
VRYEIEVRVLSEVTSIDRQQKQITVNDLQTGRTYTEGYDKLILSPGAEPLRPPLPGIDLDTVLTLRTVPDTDRIKAIVDERGARSAVVVGGGFIGLEMAENLVRKGLRVTMVEALEQVMAPLDPEMAIMVSDHVREKGVALRLGDGVKSFEKRGSETVVTTSAGAELACDLVLLSVGVRPESRLAREAGLELGPRGHIQVDDYLRTSDADIFAVGDAIEVKDFIFGSPTAVPLAGPANKQGRIAASNALGRQLPFKGTQGTAIVKVFELAVACTGCNHKTLERNATPHLASYTHQESHPFYYPGAEVMAIKLLFSPSDGKVLGAQIVGGDGVDKRIDVIATAIRAGMTVYDLEELELSYAPPFSTAKDPVNVAGYVAANMLRGDLETINATEIDSLDREENVLVDLREKREIALRGQIARSEHIPLYWLRDNLPRLDRSKTYIAYCAVGYRGYIGYRILVQNGFRARNLSGGFESYLPIGKNNTKRK